MDLSFLPALNATLNGCAFVLLILGFLSIKNRKREVHKRFMVSALICSALFLISYLIYHYSAGVTRFAGEGWARTLYFTILYTHTPLAAAILPLIIITVSRAWRSRFDKHKRIARWTLPLWLYVSITGVLIYFMLYQWFPSR